jgi:hypothetical protein
MTPTRASKIVKSRKTTENIIGLCDWRMKSRV